MPQVAEAAVLALLAALLWGTTDFVARLAGQKVGIYRTMFWGQLFGALVLGAWAAEHIQSLLRASHPPSLTAWMGAVGAGVSGCIGTTTLYLALIRGRLSVVAPIVASYGAISTLISVAAGEHITIVTILGVACVTVGAALVAALVRPDASTTRNTFDGLPWALLSAVSYGLQFWLQGHYATAALGAIVPVWIYHAVSFVLLAALAPLLKPDLRLARGREPLLIFGTATLAVAGYVAAAAGLVTGQVAVVSTLSALQSAVTVVLAAIFLREDLRLGQWVGVGLIVGGLALVNA